MNWREQRISHMKILPGKFYLVDQSPESPLTADVPEKGIISGQERVVHEIEVTPFYRT